MSGSTRIFEWAQPVSGPYDEAGAWLVGGVATQDVPTAADDVIFDTGSAAPYTVSGGGSAADRRRI